LVNVLEPGDTKEVEVCGKTWTIKMLDKGEEIGSSRPTFKVIDGPIKIVGYWYRESAAKKNIKKQYRRYLRNKKKATKKNT